jgi:SAM-dependent methyltransferase
MKGQPCLEVGYPEPYAATADTYDRLAQWAVEQWGETPRPQMAEFLQSLWSDRAKPVRNVLEICCGTGLMLEQLRARGYAVTGLDRSSAMLSFARKRLGPGVELIESELPAIPVGRTFDAVVCAAAALNYMPDAATLTRTFENVAGLLEPGSPFVFDILSRNRLETRFAQQWAADLGDLAFIWRFQHDSSGRWSDLTYTQFQRATDSADSSAYTAARELHRLYVLDRGTVEEAARTAGFKDIHVYDNYRHRPANESTPYQTWVLTRA